LELNRIKIIYFFCLTLYLAFGQKIYYVGHPNITDYNHIDLRDVHNKLIEEHGDTISETITIEVYDDWYPDSTLIWKLNGSSEHKIRIIGDKNGRGDKPIFYGSLVDTNSGIHGSPVLRLKAGQIIIQNIHFKSFYGASHHKENHKNYNKGQHRVALNIRGNNNTIQFCKFSDFSGPGPEAAIAIPDGIKNNTIEKCVFNDLNGDIYLHAIYINGGDSNIVINNMVEDCSGGTFKVKNMAVNNKFINNTIKKCRGAAYFVSQFDNTKNLIRGTKTYGPDPDSSYYGGFIKSVHNTHNDLDTWDHHNNDNSWKYMINQIPEGQDLVIGSSPASIDIGTPLENAYLKYDNTDWYRWGFIDENKDGRIDGQESIKLSFEESEVNTAFNNKPDTMVTKFIFRDKNNSTKPRVIGPFALYSRFINDNQEFLIQNKDSYYLEKWIMEEGKEGLNDFTIIGAGIEIFFTVRNCDDYTMSLKTALDSLIAYSNSGSFISKLNNNEKYTISIDNQTDRSFTFIAEPINTEAN